MSTQNKKALKESILEMLRLTFIASVSGVLAVLPLLVGLIDSPYITAGLMAFLTVLGRGYDKFLQKKGLTGGLTGF